MQFGLLCGTGPKAEGFKAALLKRGHQAPLHITYQDFIRNPAGFKALLQQIDILRIDSPGGGYGIWKCFADYTGISTSTYQDRHGQIYPQGPYVAGTNDIIESAQKLAVRQRVPCNVQPSAVRCFMDKAAAHELCRSNGIAAPEALPEVKGWAELDAAMKDMGLRRVFMKLRYGSAASGVLAIETLGSKIRVWTSTERIERDGKTQLFNSLKIQKYLDEDAKHLIDDVAAMGVHTEAWIPKLRLDDRPCDLRVLVINGAPAHCVVRRSSTPLTNLHLSNERLSLDHVQDIIPNAAWQSVLEIVREAGQLFPEHMCIGVDIAIHKDSLTPYLLEVNAFGDHLNNVTHDGLNPYEFQIRCWEKTHA